MAKQMRATAYVISHPREYNKARREASRVLLELRTAEYDAAIERRTAERLERLAAKHAAIKEELS